LDLFAQLAIMKILGYCHGMAGLLVEHALRSVRFHWRIGL